MISHTFIVSHPLYILKLYHIVFLAWDVAVFLKVLPLLSTKIETTELSFILSFYFNEELEKLKNYICTYFRYERVPNFVIDYT